MSKSSLEQLFDQFLAAKSQEDVLTLFSGIKTQISELSFPSSNSSIQLYHSLRKHLQSWRAQSIWKILDERVNHKVYEGNSICEGKRSLIIGAGPIGLRMAVECSLLGAETHIIEKRTAVTRNNILHLWPFTIDDLRRLGAKKFYGQFCAGAIDHISIRQLQLILLKVCCLLGVHVHVGVEFVGVEEPCVDKKGECTGWGINVSPHPPQLPRWRWDVMVQASGRQHVLPLFQYKECRGQQAIGMTMNFVNRGTMEELTIEEISGIAFIYNQEFFNDMYTELGIALENIVYYKDETHYFVMSTKKHSLISKHVLKKDYPTTSELLSPDNIDYAKAQQFAREVAGFATNLPVLEFMTNHHGKADVAIFDFSAIKIAANSAMVVERKGHKLLMALTGDSLLEPFWPQGTGCARGFLSVLNTGWMMKKFYQGVQVYEVLRERESLFKLLAQSSPMKLNNKHEKYTIDPSTRYNYWTCNTEQYEVFHLYNKGDTPIHDTKARSGDKIETPGGGGGGVKAKRRSRQDRRKTVAVTLNRSSRETKEPEIQAPPTPTLEQGLLLNWARESTCGYAGVRVSNLTTAWKSGLAFSALVHRYRPDLLNFTSVSKNRPEQILTTVFNVANKELGVSSPLTAKELANASIPDRQKIISYLTALYNHFNSEASKSLQISPDMCYYCSRHITPDQLTSSHGIKFHSSCLKCEYCLDKISLNTLHFVNNKTADELAKRRKPGFQFLKSGFYCKFHFKEFFTPSSSSLYPENWLSDKETDIISVTCSEPFTPETDPLTNVTSHDDSRDVIMRENSSELRRAKSVASVRNLKELFENISTGTIVPPDQEKETPEKIVPNNIYDRLMNIHSNLGAIPKSKSFHGLPGAALEPEIVENALAGFSPDKKQPVKSAVNGIKSYDAEAAKKSPTSKKKKSGVAKRIEKRRESSSNLTSKTDSNRQPPPTPPRSPDPPSPNDSIRVVQNKKKNKFKFFRKKAPERTTSIVLENLEQQPPLQHLEKDSELDTTSSIVITNNTDPMLYNTSISPEIMESDAQEFTPHFLRNSFERRTAPPKLKSPVPMVESDELVDSTACRSRVMDNLSREAVVLKTNSPQARSLLRSSVRNSKRGSHASVTDDTPQTPKTSRIQIARADAQQAYISPIKPDQPRVESIVSKTLCSPKPKRAQKVKVDNIEVVNEAGPQISAELRIVHHTICSPKPQRSKKVRLSRSFNRLQTGTPSSGSESDTPPERPDPPRDIPLSVSISSSETNYASLETKPTSGSEMTNYVSLQTVPTSGYVSQAFSPATVSAPSSGSSSPDSPPPRPAPPLEYLTERSVLPSEPPRSLPDETPALETPASETFRSSESSGRVLPEPTRSLPELILEPVISLKTISTASLKSESAVDLIPAPQSTTSLTSSSSSSTFTTSLTDMAVTTSVDSPGQVPRGVPLATTSSSSSSTDASHVETQPSLLDTKIPYLLKYDESSAHDTTTSSSDMSEIKSDPTTARTAKPFMYAKRSPVDAKLLKRSVTTPSPDPSEYHTPKSHKSSPGKGDENFLTPDQERVVERSANEIPVVPPEKPPRRRSIKSDSRSDSKSDSRPESRTDSKSEVESTPPPRKSTTEPSKDRRVERVLQENMSPAEHSSINSILQKYRKLPTPTTPTSPTTTFRHTSVSERRANFDKVASVDRSSFRGEDKRKHSGSHNRVKMITQLSASFDKTIDKLVNKYHPAKKPSSPPCTRKESCSEPKKASPPCTRTSERRPTLQKSASVPSEKVQTCSPDDSPRKTEAPGSPAALISRSDKSRDSTRSRDVIPVDPSLLRYDRNSSFRDKLDPRQTTPAAFRGDRKPAGYRRSIERQASTPARHTPRVTPSRGNVTPSRVNTAPNARRVDKFKYEGKEDNRPEKRTEKSNKSPTASKPTSKIDVPPKRRSLETEQTISYIEEQAPLRDKRDYNRYLKSLYYQYSSPQHRSNRMVENGIKAFQRKQTDV